MNYMDYTNDKSMYMFTNGQKAIITATMNGAKAPLKTSNGCSPLNAVEYFLSSQSASVFPNPCSGEVSVSIHVPGVSSVDITVYNAVGEAVLFKKVSTLSSIETKIDLGNNPTGIYLLKIKTSEGTIVKKIAINR